MSALVLHQSAIKSTSRLLLLGDLCVSLSDNQMVLKRARKNSDFLEDEGLAAASVGKFSFSSTVLPLICLFAPAICV